MTEIVACVFFITSNNMIFLVQFGINKFFLKLVLRLQIALVIRFRAILLAIENKITCAYIYSKLQSNSCDYQNKFIKSNNFRFDELR